MTWNKDDYFPALASDKMVAVAYSGGKESEILAKLAIEQYGVDRVLFLFFMPKSDLTSPEALGLVEKINMQLQAIGAKHVVQFTKQDKHPNEEYPLVTTGLFRQAAVYLEIEDPTEKVLAVYTGMTKIQLDLLCIKNLPELSDGTYPSIIECIKNNSQFHYLDGLVTPETRLLDVEPSDVQLIVDSLIHPFKDLTREQVEQLI